MPDFKITVSLALITLKILNLPSEITEEAPKSLFDLMGPPQDASRALTNLAGN